MILLVGLKLALVNIFVLKVTQPEDRFWNGVGFGFLSAAIVFSPLFLIRWHKYKIAVIINLIISIILLVDVIYSSFFFSLPTFGLLGSAGQVGDVLSSIPPLLKWQQLLLFFDIFAIIIFRNKIKNAARENQAILKQKKLNYKRSLPIAGIMIVSFVLPFFAMGDKNIAVMINKCYDTKESSQYYGVLITHAIDATRFVIQETTHPNEQQVKEVVDWIAKNKPKQQASFLNGIAREKNIIIIQVESLGAFVLNQKVNGKSVTPTLDELSRSSEFFPNTKFIIGGGHSSDSDFVVNTSYFPLDDSSAFVRYGNSNFSSLPKTLKESNYSTYAYHGNNRFFWNRNVAFNSLGYEKFYAIDNYSGGSVLNMGISDGDFLARTADYVISQPKPSLSYIITLSSHVAFDLSSETHDLGIDIRKYPGLTGNYLEIINYTDRMLGIFFEKLKQANIFDDSLIIVYGDHTPILENFNAGTIEYIQDSNQGKDIPLIIKLPNQTQGNTHTNTGSTIDIMPTVLDIAGITTNSMMFGKNMFADSGIFSICDDQVSVFIQDISCSDSISEEKAISSQIIRYNLFEYLSK